MAVGLFEWEIVHMKKATKFEEMIRVFNPYPLSKDDYDKFYVNTGNIRSVVNASDKIVNSLTYGEYPGMKLLFMGHKGSGKSTEIVNISKRLKSKYEIITFSMAQEIELLGMQYIDVIFVIMSQIIDFLEDNKKDIKIKDKLIEELSLYWQKEEVFEKIVEDSASLEAGGEAKLSILKQISVWGKGILKTGMESKHIIRTTVEPKVSYLLELLNQIINEINKQLKEKRNKELLLVIEDMDKLEAVDAKELFVLHRRALLTINAKMILSFPIYLVYTPEYSMIRDDFADCVLFSMIKVREKNGDRHQAGIDILKQIVYKRMDDALIEDEALDYMICKTGGAIRDLFELLKQAAYYRLGNLQNDSPISIDDARIVETGLKATYERFLTSEAHIKKLQQVYKEPIPDYADEVLSDLLRTLAVIEYNGDRWCGVHPLLVDFLIEKGLIENE